MKRTILILTLAIAATAMTRAQVAIIVNPSVPVNSIDTKSLIDIYMLTQTTWKDDSPIRVFALKKGAASTERFYASIGLNILTLNKVWLRVQLTGEGRAPTMSSEDDIVERVAATPGAIGFVDVSRVTAKVKVIRQVGQ